VSVRTVLVVDDDPDIRELVAWKLGQAGFATLAAADGEAALALATGHAPGSVRRPDLILLDWMMPKMSGLEVCRALHSDPSTADIPIIFLTAKVQEAEVERGFAAGIDDYIVKPFSPREMLSRVEAVLARSLAQSRP
jgi:two-component system phosphate regulon response regulator PhoB